MNQRIRDGAFVFAVLLTSSVWSKPLDEVREWSDVTGDFRVQASYVEHDDVAVKLKRTDGTVITVPLNLLSAADGDYLGVTATSPGDFKASSETPPGLVAVFITGYGSPATQQGLIVKVDGDTALIEINSPVSANYVSRLGPEFKARVAWNHGQGQQTVDGKIATVTAAKKMFLEVSHPSIAEWPKLVVQSMPNDAKLQLATIKFVGQSWPPQIKSVTYPCSISRTYYQRGGQPARWGAIAPREVGVTNWVVLHHDTVIAYGRAADGDELDIVPLNSPRVSATPSLRISKVTPISGDVKQVQYEITADVYDPLGRVKSFVATVTPVTGNPRELTATGDPVTVQFDRQENVSDEITRWSGRFAAANPGLVRVLKFRSTGKFEVKESSPIWFRFVISTDLKNLAVPKIPGLDGTPLDMPRPVKSADGSYQLTSETSRYRSTAAVAVEPLVSKPAEVVATTQERDIFGSSFVTSELPRLGAGINGMSQTNRLAFSSDGKWLFTAYGTKLLQTRVSDLKPTREITFTKSCPTSIHWSAAGLVVANATSGYLYVLDPETLDTRHTIRILSCREIACWPNSSVAVCLGRGASSAGRMSYSRPQVELFVVDLALGKVVHVIKSSYTEAPSMQPKVVVLEGGETALEAGVRSLIPSPNGKHVIGVGAMITRYRLAGTDLIFESQIKRPEKAAKFVFNADGTELIGRSNSSDKTTTVTWIKTDKLAEQREATLNVGITSLTCHPNGTQFVGSEGVTLFIFDNEGNHQRTVTLGKFAPPLDRIPANIGFDPTGRIAYVRVDRVAIGELRPEKLTPWTFSLNCKPIKSNGVLLRSADAIQEISLSGENLQSFKLPQPPYASAPVSVTDAVIDGSGNVHFMVSFRPNDSSIDPSYAVVSLDTRKGTGQFYRIPHKNLRSRDRVGQLALGNNGEILVMPFKDEAMSLNLKMGLQKSIPAGAGFTVDTTGDYWLVTSNSKVSTFQRYDGKMVAQDKFTVNRRISSFVTLQNSIYYAYGTTIYRNAYDGTARAPFVIERAAGVILGIRVLSKDSLIFTTAGNRTYSINSELQSDSLKELAVTPSNARFFNPIIPIPMQSP